MNGFVKGNMAVVANAAVDRVDAAGLNNGLADCFKIKRIREMALAGRHVQIRFNAPVKIAQHITFQIEGVVRGQRPALPIEKIIHMKDVEVFEAEPLPVDGFGKNLILGGWTTWQNPAERLVSPVSQPDFLEQCLGECLDDLVGRRNYGERNFGLGMVGQFGRGNAAPFVELYGIDLRSHCDVLQKK